MSESEMANQSIIASSIVSFLYIMVALLIKHSKLFKYGFLPSFKNLLLRNNFLIAGKLFPE